MLLSGLTNQNEKENQLDEENRVHKGKGLADYLGQEDQFVFPTSGK